MPLTAAQEYILRYGKTGDVIGFSGTKSLSAFINAVTYGLPFWSISHVGILCELDGEMLIFHSLVEPDGLECRIQGRLASGAQAQLVTDVIHCGGKVWHYPLYRPLYLQEIMRLRKNLKKKIGTPYDRVGAAMSGGILVSTVTSIFADENCASLFCSEWVANELSDVGIFPTGNFSAWSPNNLVRRGRAKGIFKRPIRIV